MTADSVSARAARSAYISPRSSWRRAESSAWGVMRTVSVNGWPRAARRRPRPRSAPMGGTRYAVARRPSGADMLRSEVTAERFHQRQAECLPGKFGVVVTRIAEGRLDAELTLQPWMMAPNGFLHAASVLAAGRHRGRLREHRPPAREGEELHHRRAEEQLSRHRARREDPHRVRRRAPRPDDARLVGDRVRARRQADRAVPLHAADPVVTSRRPGRGGGGAGAGRAGAHAMSCLRPPLDDREIEELQALLDSVPAPFEPLDVSSLDGFLCGVIVQPRGRCVGALAALRHRRRRPRSSRRLRRAPAARPRAAARRRAAPGDRSPDLVRPVGLRARRRGRHHRR